MIAMQTTKKYPSNDQSKLKILCDDLCDNIESLFDYFNLEYKDSGKMITMSCPIHGGDNPGALNLYVEGDTYRGNWKCRTHNCEKVFKESIIGFVRGILSHNKHNWSSDKDKVCSFKETIDFITKFLKKDLASIKVSNVTRNKSVFTNAIKQINNTPNMETKNLLNRQTIRRLLDIPATYFIDRGYSKEILDKYDVGFCASPNKEMYNRVVVPIYDPDYTYMIGCSGRSIFEKCQECQSFHASQDRCPDKDYAWRYSKWKHSANFKSQNCLYNFWFAKKSILETNTAIIVESPGNVWRLEEAGIHNSVAIFGCSLSDRQKIILDCSGAMNLVVLSDNDEAGRKAADQIKEKCKNTYNVYVPAISKGDVGEMTIEEINQEIKPLLEKIL